MVQQMKQSPNLTKTLEKFFYSTYRLECLNKYKDENNSFEDSEPKFISVKEFGEFIKSAQESIEEILFDLDKNYGVDGNKYITSDKGKAEYAIFCSTDDQMRYNEERCSRCTNWWVSPPNSDQDKNIPPDNSEIGCIKYIGQGYGVPYSIVICRHFVDSSYSSFERVSQFMWGRCASCTHHYTKTSEIGCLLYRCEFSFNMGLPECLKFEENSEELLKNERY
jgi:hypothetical protein